MLLLQRLAKFPSAELTFSDFRYASHIAILVIVGVICGACQAVPPAPTAPDAVVLQQSDTEHSHFPRNDVVLVWESMLEQQFDRARELVENELKVDLNHIKLRLVSEQPINHEVEFETKRLIHDQFDRTEFANHFISQVMQPLSGTYAALFSSRLQAVLINRAMLANFARSLPDDNTIRESALLTLLLHELVHAADDVRYQIHANRALSFRASFAQSATFEGHAQWVTRQICTRTGCLSGLKALDSFMFSLGQQPAQLTQPVEAISRNVLEYSYVEGERFVNALSKRRNGAQLIDQLLRSPPSDPIQILSPDSFPDHDRESRNQKLVNASKSISHQWMNAPWAAVETSPLKGINLRNDPSRRQAAVDGFTQLITGMVAMQFYDQSNAKKNPVEVTLMQTDSAHTAKLFATTLHQNTQTADTQVHDEPLRINAGEGTAKSQMNLHLYRTRQTGKQALKTTIGVSGPYVVQTSGITGSEAIIDDYVIRVLLNLQLE